MLEKLENFRENYELVKEFDLPLDEENQRNAEFILGLAYDSVMKGFWKGELCYSMQSILEKIRVACGELKDRLDAMDTYLDIDDVVSIMQLKKEPRDLFTEVLKIMVDNMRVEVGSLGSLLSDEVWSELVEKIGIEVSPEILARRDRFKDLSDFIEFCDSTVLSSSDELEERFEKYIEEVEMYEKLIRFTISERDIMDSYSSLFALMSVDEESINDFVDEFNKEVNILIEQLDDSESKIDEELSTEVLEEVSSDDDFEPEFKENEAEVWSNYELFNEYVSEEIENFRRGFDTFLKNPKFTRSLLRMFGIFKVSVEREDDLDDRIQIIELFLGRLVAIGEKSDWSSEARRSFRESVIESFRGYPSSISPIIQLLDSLNFESDLEREIVYHPSGIRIENNVQINFRDWRNVVRKMGGVVNNNGHGRHAEFVVPFELFDWTYPIPTNFFKGKHERFARVFVNELSDFMSMNGIESLTMEDFNRLQEAYDSIGVKIEYRV